MEGRIHMNEFRKLLESAEQGCAEAQYMLAECYFSGEGVKEDLQEALKWFLKAAEQGHAEAQHEVGYYFYDVKKDLQEALKWFFKAAEQGHAEAQYRIGCYYLNNKDYELAKRWLRKSADQFNFDAVQILYDVFGENVDHIWE